MKDAGNSYNVCYRAYHIFFVFYRSAHLDTTIQWKKKTRKFKSLALVDMSAIGINIYAKVKMIFFFITLDIL